MAQNRLLEKYRNEVVPALMEEFGYSSVMQVPRLKKVVVNIGLGEALDNPKALEAASISGYTMIPSVAGRGDRGTTVHGLGLMDNAYLLIACEVEQTMAVVEAIRPFLKRFGGVCLVSDAQWVIH